MKHLLLLLSLSLVLVLANVARADSFDSDTATIKKGKSDKSAKVMLDKKTFLVPISFGDGASWDSVKDHYELSDASAAAVKSGKASVSVASDGTLSWKK
jgi:hypothetical protein